MAARKPKDKPKIVAPKDLPGAPKEGRPGHNGGGWLMSGIHDGNRGKTGRKPAEVRASMLQTVDDATEVMRAILDGEFQQPVFTMFGELSGYRPATIKELAIIFKALADHALPTRSEMSGPNGGPIPIETSDLDVDALLDRMSAEDLDLMKGIAARVHGRTAPE